MPAPPIMSGYGPAGPPIGPYWATAAWPAPKTAAAAASRKFLIRMAVSSMSTMVPQVEIDRYRRQIATFWNNPQTFCRFPLSPGPLLVSIARIDVQPRQRWRETAAKPAVVVTIGRMKADNRPITDSPWLWVGVFAVAGLIGL